MSAPESLSRVSGRTAPIWCKASPNAAWTRVLASDLVALSRHASVVPLALAADGRSFFASLESKAFSGVVRIEARTSRVTRIRRFPNAANDQASGSFDGRWLVWAEYHSLTVVDDFTIWSWDSKTGDVSQIGAAARSPSGMFWPSPLRHPEARGGQATWTQGIRDDGLGEVHVVDLAGGSDRIIRRAYAGGSLLAAGGLVIWPESARPGAFTVMAAADAASAQLVEVPRALRGVRGLLWPATDGTAVAYPSANFSRLWWSPSLGAPPRRVFISRIGYPIGVPVEISGRYVSFGAAPHTYLADTVTGRYVEISPGGWALVGKKSMVILQPSVHKASHSISDVNFLLLASLPPMPPCR
jgi:hypothetical protein